WSITVCVVSVSLQETVEAVVGGSVLLPCSSTEHDLKLQEMNVHWRHNGEIVSDIVKGVETVSEQDHQYKNRAETFPLEYERGNFSIKLHKLISADAGEYTCFITHSFEQPTVQLIINGVLFSESTAEKGTISTDQENQGETEPDSVETSSPSLWVVIVLVTVIVIVIVIGFIVACRIRNNSRSRRAD
ncbi:hypothetical protein PO909_027097, partial [Leuciscus waleckii]